MTNGTRRNRLKQKVTSHLPKDWLTELRIAYRIGIETIKGVAQAGLINIAIITTMAAIFTIFGAIFRTTLSVSSMVSAMGNVLEISAELKPDADINATVGLIRDIEHVKGVKYISREASWAELKREIDVPDVRNPLPDTLHIKVDDPDNIEFVMNRVKVIPGVADLSYAKDLVAKFQMINKISHTITLVVVIIACILTITIINNTIELVIQSRKEEIEIMRLMGVSNWYIKSPLVLQGAIYGFMGALVAIIPINIVQGYLQKMHEFFMMPAYSYSQGLVVFSVLLIGVLFSAVGSFLRMKKDLQV